MHHFICFALLTVGILAFIKHRMRRYGYGYGYGGGCGGGHHGHWDDHGPSFRGGGGGRWRGFGLRAVLRRLFERLDTTPGQEKVIVKAVDALRETMTHAKDELKGSRKDLADAFRNGLVDEASLADLFVRHDTVISETRRKAVESLGQIHEALDDKQRAELADLIENGPGFGRRRGPSSGYPWA